MDILIDILIVFALLGLLDDLLGNKLGLAESFERGISVMGRAALSMIGFYCIGIMLVERNSAAIMGMAETLPMDPSLVIGCLLAPDTGGLPITMKVAATPMMGVFTGALVAGGFGMTLNYQLPVFLTFLPNKYLPDLMRGFSYGIVTLPVGLLVGGLMLRIPLGTLLLNILPIFVLCIVLIVGLFLAPKVLTKILSVLGKAIRVLSYVLFGLVIADIFFPQISIVDISLVQEASYVVLRQAIFVCGGMVAAHLITTYLGRGLAALSRWLKVNEESVMGLMLGCVNSVSMFPLYEKMDRRGKAMNAAFSCCGSYILGGQLAMVLQLVPSSAVPAYVVSKMLCAVLAILLAGVMEGRKQHRTNS